MRKWWLLLTLPLLFSGCASEEVFETVADDLVESVMAQPREITVDLPDNAVAPVLGSGGEQVYLSEEYEIVIETLSSGDVDGTIRDLSGYDGADLTVMQTRWGELTRYEFVWACAGEQGDRLGRGVILDDGSYHYCLSVLRDAQAVASSQIVWSDVFQSFSVS